jgi:GT2 family glycosyltransferase
MDIHHQVAIVTLSKYPDLFAGLQENLNEFAPGYDRVVVLDGKLISEAKGWKVVYGPKEFNISTNANLGINATDPECDIFYLGDDVRLLQKDTIPKLRALAYSDEAIGILSPKVIGGADNELQTNPPTEKELVYSDRYFALAVGTYLKRSMLNTVGIMDDDVFKGYGWDDVDYCRRVRQRRFKLAVSPHIEVQHGLGTKGTDTFKRNVKGYYEDIQAEADRNEQAYISKWGSVEEVDKKYTRT